MEYPARPAAVKRERLEAAIAAVAVLHYRRPHRLGDFVHFGQTEFPDLCNHCGTPYPCATAAAMSGGV